jgi:hypothetical protein
MQLQGVRTEMSLLPVGAAESSLSSNSKRVTTVIEIALRFRCNWQNVFETSIS